MMLARQSKKLMLPVACQLKRHHSSIPRYSTRAETASLQVERWTKNISRLYARRILELAAASAASMAYKTRLQEKVMQRPPTSWQDWARPKDWSEDLRDEIGATFISRWATAVARITNLAILATPLVVCYPLSYVSETAENFMWDYALWGIEQAGPTFIKFIQWATTRQDMFSQQFCTHFGKLRDQTRGHGWEDTEKLLNKELGPNWRDLVELESKPIGSGCIAQVYKGKLKESTPTYQKGTDVALKIQHPNIMRMVCVDFFILGGIANFLEGLPFLNLDYLSIRDTVDQFCNIMLHQLDLSLEADNLDRFNKDFANDDQVQFPRPIHELSTPKLLTETFCSGSPILDYLTADEATRKDLAYLGLTTTLKMIFLHDFIHGDLHPGNILVSRNARGKLLLTLLDCGLVIEFGPKQHETVIKILGSFARRQGYQAGKLMVDTSSKCQAGELDVKMFIHGIQQIVEDDARVNFVEHIGDYIADICYLACRHKVKLEAAFINAALAVEIMEGIASSLYSNTQVISTALPMVAKAEFMHKLQWR